MVTKIMEWVFVTALLLAVTWRPSANYQILLHIVLCAGAVMLVLSLFFIKHESEAHYDFDSGFKSARRVTIKLRAWQY
jgi:hypothetical protein